MKVVSYKDLDKIKPNVACIGYFDGVHKGHKELIKKTVFYAKKLKVEPCLITFYPDPKSVVNGKSSELINTFNKRCELFEKYGIKKVIIIDFNKKIMNMKHDIFVSNILSKLMIKRLICGFDFTYGQMGSGNIETLKDDLKDIKLTIVSPVKYKNKKISSTLISSELSKGHIDKVNTLLGYDYSLALSIYDSSLINDLRYYYANVIDTSLVKLKNKKYNGYLYINKKKVNIEFIYNNSIISFCLNKKIKLNKEIELFIK